MEKLNKNEDYKDYYLSKESAIEYDEVSYKEGTYGSVLWEIEKEKLINHLKNFCNTNKNIRYLDFACGTGRIVSLVEAFVEESNGIDISQSMLDRAAQKTKHTNLIQGDITKDVNIIKGKYDLITTFRFVLNANPELREEALGILSEKLQSRDSWLIFNMHTNKYSYAFLSYLWIKIFGQSKDKDLKRFMSINDCKLLARKAHLDIVKIEGLGFLSSKIFRILPHFLGLNIEKTLSKIPLINLLGTDLIFFCKKKE
ncbi:MAG: class I SAM-dependent methyltransferase [Bacteroidota bacterium]|nr:class I SAM-dependent methyltransferase [Bacteroidota bacterium]